MRELVELLYANSEYTLAERVSYANSKAFNPYPAFYAVVGGVQYQGEIFCGHNPMLHARLVDNPEVEMGPDGEEHLRWDERPRPLFFPG